ncbi:MAG: glycosyltransferase [Candidatus Eisenbacteria bacterium]|nr:glycosyltransferase [Candidatus Eisenbacteria bacterium]
MTDERPLIICCSTQYWEETWFRKQHFMAHLAPRRDIVYVEPSHSILRPKPSTTPTELRNPLLAPRLRSVRDGLRIWTPPRGLPFWTHAPISRAQYRLWGGALARTAARLGHRRTWLWLYQPLWAQAIETLRPERVIFDLVDDLSAYEAQAHSQATMARSIEIALAASNLVLTTSDPLAAQVRRRRPEVRVEVVGNGVRETWLDDRELPVPPELAGLPRPWLGFVGAVFTYLDYEVLDATARAFPGGSLILVGPIHAPAAADALRRHANVHLLGARPQAEIPRYLRAFDLCLSPFKVGAVRRAVNPLKVYEYLGAGRPVVSTPLESLLETPVGRMIRFAEGPERFVAAVRETLAEEADLVARGEAKAIAARRRDAVRPHTWEALAGRVEAILDEMEQTWRG